MFAKGNIREKERSEVAAIRTLDATSENHDTGTIFHSSLFK